MNGPGLWKMNCRQPIVLREKNRQATGHRLTVMIAVSLLLGLGAATASGQHHGDGGINPHTLRNVKEHSPATQSSAPAALPSPASSNQHVMQAQAVKPTAMTARTSATTTNILPQVPSTAFIQVPPVPADPFVPPPAAITPPPPASRPMTVGLSGASAYQVNCVLPGGSYCLFTNSFFVASGSVCHCGTAAGKTE
jgi:hypothetical protein